MAVTPSFLISAPGKVILFGEHAVVYGKTAIAASLGLRTYLLAVPNRKESTVSLVLPDVKVNQRWTCEELNTLSRAGVHCEGKSANRVSAHRQLRFALMLAPFVSRLHGVYSLFPILFHDRVEQVDDAGVPVPMDGLHPQLMDAVSEHTRQYVDASQSMAVAAFLVLYRYIIGTRLSGVSITVRSTLPVGAGLGSSASFSVCLAAGLLAVAGFLDPSRYDKTASSLVNRWAFVAEKVIHGNPSGIDNTISTFGGAQTFANGVMQPLNGFRSCKFILTNTKVPRSTRVQVASVKQKKEMFPGIFNSVFDSIQAVCEECQRLFSSGASQVNLQDNLEMLININHHLIASTGVSHPSLEKVREVTARHGLHSKLTGAGGGGCAVTLIRDDTPLSTVVKTKTELNDHGYECFETCIGGPGVGILRLDGEAGGRKAKEQVNRMMEERFVAEECVDEWIFI